MMTRVGWRAIALLVAAFVVGALAGAGAMAVVERSGPAAHQHGGGRGSYLDRLTRTLDLTPAQRDSVQAVLERRRPAMDSIWRETRPRLETLRASIRSEIRSHLNPEQQRQYEEMSRRHRKRDEATR